MNATADPGMIYEGCPFRSFMTARISMKDMNATADPGMIYEECPFSSFMTASISTEDMNATADRDIDPSHFWSSVEYSNACIAKHMF